MSPKSARLLVPALAGVLLLLLVLAGCRDLSDSVLVVPGSGTVRVSAFVDADGSGAREGSDPPLVGFPVAVRHAAAAAPHAAGITDTLGVAVLEVEVGTLRLVPPTALLADTLVFVRLPEAPFVVRSDTTVLLELGVAYPQVPLAQVAALPPGRRVFTSGIALNAREPFGDGEVHIRLDTVALRVTRVERVTVAPGDSVRIVGRTRIQEGRMTLDSANLFTLAGGVSLVIPHPLSTGEARTALGGRRDAWLVEIREALITATRMEGPHPVVTADDGSGPVEVVFRDYLLFDGTNLVPGNTLVRAAGLLRPAPGSGGTVWRVLPRGGGDVAVRVAPSPDPSDPESGG